MTRDAERTERTAQEICVLVITSSLGGGTGTQIASVARLWVQSGLDVRIATERAPSTRVAVDVPLDELSGGRSRLPFPLAQLIRLRMLAGIVREVRPDIVHSYFFWPVVYGRFLKALGRVSLLVENREDQGFNWGIFEYAVLWLTRGIPDRIVCVSEAVRETVRKREKIGEDRLVVIHNGVAAPPPSDTSRDALRSELGLSLEQPIVGMVANYTRPVKGLTFFLEAIPLIVRSVPGVRFLLVGRGAEESDVREEAARRGIDAHLVVTGFRSDIDRFYELMDISVLTSATEGLSITLLESMSHGLPVVATDVGGNSELVRTGETGFLVPFGDANAFADCVTLLLNSDDLRKRMGDAGRNRVMKDFQLQTTASAYTAVYAALLRR